MNRLQLFHESINYREGPLTGDVAPIKNVVKKLLRADMRCLDSQVLTPENGHQGQFLL